MNSFVFTYLFTLHKWKLFLFVFENFCEINSWLNEYICAFNRTYFMWRWTILPKLWSVSRRGAYFSKLLTSQYMTVRNIANFDRPSFIADLSSVSELSSVENSNQFCKSLRIAIDKHASPSLRKVVSRDSSPWFWSISDELFMAMRERRQAER